MKQAKKAKVEIRLKRNGDAVSIDFKGKGSDLLNATELLIASVVRKFFPASKELQKDAIREISEKAIQMIDNDYGMS